MALTNDRRKRVVILGAAGRDFHNFNCLFRQSKAHEVVAFTATQIPDIEGRRYPPELAGPLYPQGIPILPEEQLETLVVERKVDEVWFSYSDVSYQHVMDLGSRVVARGAHFVLASAKSTLLESTKPVIAITAVRTGVGKSQTSRFLARLLAERGLRTVAIRHPMPYGDLGRQVCQRFSSYEDLDHHRCTIEEREEYEPHIDHGFVVYAGVDYEKILRQAESEAEVILWDGGNNDTPFLRPDLHICLLDPHRPGDELRYYPGQTNLVMADLLVINKVNTAEPEKVQALLDSCRRHNPDAPVVQCASKVMLDQPELVRGKRAVVVEDGPTLTHGGMSYGAGWIAARDAGAAEIVDPSPYGQGSIRDTYERYPNARKVVPAMGYGEQQIRELEATLEAIPADAVVEGTPIDLRRVLELDKPIANVSYELEELDPGSLAGHLDRVLEAARGG
ncbi:MAG: cyclic 2,3-diphosphoglycerate synthase [Holophagales bacterium]|nr:cyclic 2,3-diphosphoglycerate synthase [Holophagales bacterium]